LCLPAKLRWSNAMLLLEENHTLPRSHIQLSTSPFQDEVDFSPLNALDRNAAQLDLVSIADLLRNTFVYPPHSIYRHVKLAASGFNPEQDMRESPSFHYAFQSFRAPVRPASSVIDDDALLNTYHRLLCSAVTRSTAGMRSPWLLQSGGKDSTSMAIAVADVRPDATCLTYLGGSEENEIESARYVARQLGLRHEALVCDTGRAYDRYLTLLPRMPLLTADFAALSYADLATEISLHGDGLIDAIGSDPYLGAPLQRRERLLARLAGELRLPPALFRSPLINRSFTLCFALGTLQMNRFERYFPGSRFSDAEVDELFGCGIAALSKQRMDTFHAEIAACDSAEAERRLAFTVLESANIAKGMYAAKALSLPQAYPNCDRQLRDWIFHHVPADRLISPEGQNKVLVRRYIARRFNDLPYVKSKGCFRFDLRGLARQRFEQVHAFAEQTRDLVPGAPKWLEQHRNLLDNKFFASKFYLLAVTLPWLLSRKQGYFGPATATSHVIDETVTV
jgi:hypothetical protein